MHLIFECICHNITFVTNSKIFQVLGRRTKNKMLSWNVFISYKLRLSTTHYTHIYINTWGVKVREIAFSRFKTAEITGKPPKMTSIAYGVKVGNSQEDTQMPCAYLAHMLKSLNLTKQPPGEAYLIFLICSTNLCECLSLSETYRTRLQGSLENVVLGPYIFFSMRTILKDDDVTTQNISSSVTFFLF